MCQDRLQPPRKPHGPPPTRAEVEQSFTDRPATDWPDFARKLRYLIGVFAATPQFRSAGRRRLVEAVLSDLDSLLEAPAADAQGSGQAPPSPYVILRERNRWLFEIGGERFGPYSTRADAVAAAKEAANEAVIGMVGSNEASGSR
jgi:hypothetical protein